MLVFVLYHTQYQACITGMQVGMFVHDFETKVLELNCKLILSMDIEFYTQEESCYHIEAS